MMATDVTGSDWAEFELAAPWVGGTTVLEASAGTGKTWTIAALATRWVAQGQGTLDELLLVTFGRSASLELRERVRAQLAEAHRWLAADPSGQSAADAGALHALLTAGGDHDRAARRERLATALAGFDGATIATTHTFCSRMLAGLGIAGDHDPRAELHDDLSVLRRQVIGDSYLQRYAQESRPRLTFSDALSLGNRVLDRPGSRLEPREPERPSDVERVEFARRVVATMRQRKRRGALMDYDDLQLLLRDAVVDPVAGELAARVLRQRYRVVMVDEFQDTDPVQWEILQTVFHGHCDLILIGDPKQAIYAFRGGDVVTYLQATSEATRKLTLSTNWRADGPLVHGVGLLLNGLALGDPRIAVRPVTAAEPGRRLEGAGPAVRIRQVTCAALATDKPRVGVVRPFVDADLAADIARLLTSGATLRTASGVRPVEPGDIVILVERNDRGAPLRRALARLGIPAVDTATSSVFATEAAGHWRVLLQALESPHRPGPARAAILSPFIGWTAQQLASAVEGSDVAEGNGDDAGSSAARAAADELDVATTRLGEWATLLRERGVATAFEAISVATSLPARLLAQPGGERLLTDLRHVAEIVHAVARDEELGLAGLIGWLRRRTEEASGDQNTERARRLESDARAVQITTIHRAKGLEYPIVYLPSVSDRHVTDLPKPLYLHDADGARVIEVGEWPSANQRDQHHAEEAGEDLRKFYVALTRASSQVVMWWAPNSNLKPSALHRVLFADRQLGGGLAPSARMLADDEATARLHGVAEASGGSIAVEVVTEPRPGVVVPISSQSPLLSTRTFGRQLDTSWRRTSYTGLTAAAHAEPSRAATAASEPDEYSVSDEPEGSDGDVAMSLRAAPSAASAAEQLARELISPMEALPGGAALGTVVHEVLEQFDPGADGFAPELVARDSAEVDAALLSACQHVLARRGGSLTAAGLAEALSPSLRTPMLGLAGAPAFAAIPGRDLLREADFELPMAGGDLDGRTGRTLVDIADLLDDLIPSDDRMSGYAARLRALADSEHAVELRGYLTGSIDVVARVHTPAGPQFAVLDYKTNRLGPGPLTAWDYRPSALDEAMAEAHYPLQALLYSVALHRFLRWRQPGYAPESHLGPVVYTFLRGMCGPQTPVIDGQACGVFCWQPPAGLVIALSDLLNGHRR